MNKEKSEKREADCATDEKPTVEINAVKTKIGESGDHLRRRAEWFNRRASGKKQRDS